MNQLHVEKPWGHFDRFTLNEPSTVKIISIRPQGSLSLQTHSHRQEFWKVLKGKAWVTIGDERKEAQAGDTFFIDTGVAHRIEAQDEEVDILEIALGDFDEEDIVRLEDIYGRKS